MAAIVVANLAACASDGDCSLQGNWKVKDAEVTSDKLDETVLGMAKDIMLKTTYSFTADSIVIKSGGPSGEFRGSYALDAVGQTLSWNTVGVSNSSQYSDNMKILSCNSNELKLSKRNPVDTTQAALTTSTMVLVREN